MLLGFVSENSFRTCRSHKISPHLQEAGGLAKSCERKGEERWDTGRVRLRVVLRYSENREHKMRLGTPALKKASAPQGGPRLSQAKGAGRSSERMKRPRGVAMPSPGSVGKKKE